MRNTRGSVLLDRVFDKLNLLEKDYFGLRFLDAQDQTHWLDPVKSISKQIKNGPPFILYFGVKFYMENPCKLKEEVTRYQFFLQLRVDMLQGRLPCSFQPAAELCAYSVQSELGDYDPSQHSKGYISEFRFIPSQTEELEQQITDLHQKFKGMAPSKAEMSFLERARWLEMYGVDLHPVLGDNDVEFFLGLTPTGVVVYKNKTKVARYFWPRISKVHFKDTEFTLTVVSNEGLEDECVFKLSTHSASKHLWKCCVEQHAFFRLPQTADEPIHQRKLSFSKSSFRHTGRTQREALEAASELHRPEQQINRASSRKYSRRLGQMDTSLKTAPASEDVFQDDGLPSPNGVLLRLSPQPANRLPSNHHQGGRDSPTSGMSTRSVPWEDNQQARVGLFTPAGESPVSVRSSASRQHRHRGRSKSPVPPHRHGDRSDSESEAAYSARRRNRRSQGSDAGSDHESRHHHQHRKRRSQSRGVSSGSESEYSRQDDGRRRRRRSRERMVNPEEQRNSLDVDRMVRGEMRQGKEVVVKRLRDGYPDSETSSNYYHLHQRNHHHHHHHAHYHNPRRQSERQALTDSHANAEFQKHIKKELVDPAQFTEEERNSIPYTNIRTESGVVNSYPQLHTNSRTRSKKSEDFSDSNISEHSARHRSKTSSPNSHHHAARKSENSQALTQPLGTPPPPYSPNGANRPREPIHTSKDPQHESRGEVGTGGTTIIQNGDVKASLYTGYLEARGGLFGGRPQQERAQDHEVHVHTAAPHQTNGSQHHDRHLHRHQHAMAPHPQQDPSPTLEGLPVAHSREGSNGSHRRIRHPDRHPQVQAPHPQQEPSPTLGVEGLRVEHSKEDSGLGYEYEDGLIAERQTQLSLPRQNGQPLTPVQTLQHELDITNLHTMQAIPNHIRSDLNSASQNGTRLSGQPVNRRTNTHDYDATRLQSGDPTTQAENRHIPTQTLHNGGPNYPTKLRLPPATYSQGNPSGESVPNRGPVPDWDPAPNRGTPPKGALLPLNNNNTEIINIERGVGHLWSKPDKPHHALTTSSLGDDRDVQVNGDNSTGNEEATWVDELPHFPPGYKPNYSRVVLSGTNKRYSITTQEMIRVSTLHGDHRDLQTEL